MSDTQRPGLSRRRFVQGVAAAAAPWVVPARALGKDGPAPSQRLTFGLIGCGGMGAADTMALLNQPDTQLLALCDVDPRQREGKKAQLENVYAARLGQGDRGVALYHDFRDLLARDDIDFVVIATPDHWHAIPAIEAARAGKDIYCEKPMSLTIAEALAMVDTVRRCGRVFQTGSQQRSDNRFRFACELARNGYLGRVHSVFVRVGGPSGLCALPELPPPAGMDWDRWIGPAPYRGYHPRLHPAAWRSFRDYSGGGMTDWGAHHFDIAQWGLGADGSGPVEVFPPDGGEHPVLTWRYANGTRLYHCWGPGTARLPWPDPPQGDDNGVTFVGDRGWVEVDRSHIRTSRANLTSVKLGEGDVRLYRSPGHHRNFLDCVKNREKPICDVAIGASSVTVCHLGNFAYWFNRPIRWDPERHEILGDEQVARWLDRPKRAPWTL